ncbi:MAG: MaoC family dehydratase [Myxococcales bacterium]|nr:MaoC family dehydratase [Myxococcales bacterium]
MTSTLGDHLNQEVGVSEWIPIRQPEIDAFAELTRDHQWIHTDPARARTDSPYEATVAHGFFTLSLLSHFLTSTVEVEDAKMLISCGLDSVRFLNPVPVEARVRARVRLRKLSEGDGWVEATWRFTVGCEGIRLPSCIADWVVRYQR